MILINIDWNTFLISTSSTLIVGLILARVGYYIWKKQFYYQKRLEVYGELIPHIHQLKLDLFEAYSRAGHSTSMTDIYKIESDIKPLLEKFVLYFGESNKKPIDELLNLLHSLNPFTKPIEEEHFNSYVNERIDNFILLKTKFKLNSKEDR